MQFAQVHLVHVNHFRPGENYKLPFKFADGCNRSCKYKYLKHNPWFVCSKVEVACHVFYLLRWSSLLQRNLILGARLPISFMIIIITVIIN